MKLRNYLAFALAAGVMFTSCDKEGDEDGAPIIAEFTVDGVKDATAGEHLAGDTVSIAFIATDDDEVTSYKITSVAVNTNIEEEGDIKAGSKNISTSYVVPETAQEGFDIVLTVEITDNADQTASKSYTITVGAAETELAMNKEGMFYHISGELHGAYDLVGDSTVRSKGDDAKKDMVNTNSAGTTFTGSFTAGNSTMFVQAASTFDYDNATVESAKAAYDAGTAEAGHNDPQVGDIFIAKLRGGSDYVVLKVTEVDPTYEDGGSVVGVNNGRIVFSYKKN